MFLIHHDEGEVFYGSEHGAARADGDPRGASSQSMPFVVSLTGGQMAVQNRDQLTSKPGFKPFHRLRRQ
jgi:hypothetical protein